MPNIFNVRIKPGFWKFEPAPKSVSGFLKPVCGGVALTLAFLFSACEEQPIAIPDLSVGKRKVLVEELTGVRCPNCPDGTRALVDLQKQFGKDNIIIVGVHAAGTFSVPFPENKSDYRFKEAQEMADFLGQPEGFPTAAINRAQKAGGNSLFLLFPDWAGTVADEFNKDYGLGVFLAHSFDPRSRELRIEINLAPEQKISGETRLTVLITQDSIVDAQQDRSKKVLEYTHRHVLRGLVTQPKGELIAEPLNALALITKRFTYKLPVGWDERKCSIVAFAHRGGATDKAVLQAAEEKVLK
jgi:Outer membrane protein Omp28